MAIEELVPGVHHGNKAQCAAQPIVRVLSEAQQGLGCRFEQDIEHDLLVVEDKGIEFMRQGKDGMKIDDRQKLCFSGFKPSLPWYMLARGAVPVPARVIGDSFGPTLITPFDMTAQIGGAAIDEIIDNPVLIGV